MSAQVAMLVPQLQWAVSQQAISLAEAWAFQDLLSLAPNSSRVLVPELLQPMLSRLCLLEEEPANSLPV